MAAVGQRDTTFAALEIVVFEVGRQEELRPGGDGRRNEFRAAASAQGYPPYRFGSDFAVAQGSEVQRPDDMP